MSRGFGGGSSSSNRGSSSSSSSRAPSSSSSSSQNATNQAMAANNDAFLIAAITLGATLQAERELKEEQHKKLLQAPTYADTYKNARTLLDTADVAKRMSFVTTLFNGLLQCAKTGKDHRSTKKCMQAEEINTLARYQETSILSFVPKLSDPDKQNLQTEALVRAQADKDIPFTPASIVARDANEKLKQATASALQQDPTALPNAVKAHQDHFVTALAQRWTKCDADARQMTGFAANFSGLVGGVCRFTAKRDLKGEYANSNATDFLPQGNAAKTDNAALLRYAVYQQPASPYTDIVKRAQEQHQAGTGGKEPSATR